MSSRATTALGRAARARSRRPRAGKPPQALHARTNRLEEVCWRVYTRARDNFFFKQSMPDDIIPITDVSTDIIPITDVSTRLLTSSPGRAYVGSATHIGRV